eukprot:1485104-Amphidinium_carterae.1
MLEENKTREASCFLSEPSVCDVWGFLRALVCIRSNLVSAHSSGCSICGRLATPLQHLVSMCQLAMKGIRMPGTKGVQLQRAGTASVSCSVDKPP